VAFACMQIFEFAMHLISIGSEWDWCSGISSYKHTQSTRRYSVPCYPLTSTTSMPLSFLFCSPEN